MRETNRMGYIQCHVRRQREGERRKEEGEKEEEEVMNNTLCVRYVVFPGCTHIYLLDKLGSFIVLQDKSFCLWRRTAGLAAGHRGRGGGGAGGLIEEL